MTFCSLFFTNGDMHINRAQSVFNRVNSRSPSLKIISPYFDSPCKVVKVRASDVVVESVVVVGTNVVGKTVVSSSSLYQ